MSELATQLREIGGGAIVAFAMKAVGFGATFLLSVVVARLLGVASAGHFFLALTIVTIVSTLARLGFDKPLVRLVAGHRLADDDETIRALVATSLVVVSAAAALATFAIAALADWLAIAAFSDAPLGGILRALSWSILPLTVAGVISLAYQGLHRIAFHLLFLSVLTPLLALLLIAIDRAAGLGLSMAQVYSIASAGTCLLALAAWFGAWRWPRVHLRWETLAGLAAASRATLLVICSQLLVLWAPTILLGIFGSSADVARYHVAGRTALLIGFVLIAINSISAPRFASLYKEGRTELLEATARHVNRIMTVAALPIAAIFIVWPDHILALFGEGFREGAPLLQILAASQFVNTATGSSANLLLMTGHERAFQNISMLGALINVTAGLVLIPRFGAVGAAWVSFGTLMIIKVLADISVRKHLGFSGAGWLANRRRRDPS